MSAQLQRRYALGLSSVLVAGLVACQSPDWPQHQTLTVQHLEQGVMAGKVVEPEPTEEDGSLTLGGDYLRFCPDDRRIPCWTVRGVFVERNHFQGSWKAMPRKGLRNPDVETPFDCRIAATKITCLEQSLDEKGGIAQMRHTFIRRL